MDEELRVEARRTLLEGVEEGKDPLELLDEIASMWDGDPAELIW